MTREETDETLPASPADSARTAPAAIDGYRLGELIGRGGMGEVIQAHDAKVGRDVAIKRMRDPQATEEDVARFLREARIQALLDHPAIVPVHDVGKDAAGRPYFTMKRVTGTTLAQVLASGSEKLQRLLRAFVDVCLAIELAHTRRIVHRDLKPANIMLGDYGEVYILDWGLARTLDDQQTVSSDSLRQSPTRDGMTLAGTVLGTPGYMAPEQLRGAPIGTSADVYALGAILFEILAGQPLHKEVRSRDTVQDPPSAIERSPDRAIAPELDSLCADALADEPSRRPSARELADRVQAFLDGDRDTARRRELAAQHVAASRASHAAERRSDAIREAGRAIALDPESPDAAALVTQLVIEPPAQYPPELVASLEASEVEYLKLRSKRSASAYASFVLLLPFLPLLHVTSWATVLAVFAAVAIMGLSQWINSRTASIPLAPIMVGNFILIALFSRLTGTLVITPIVICAIVLSAASRSNVAQRPLFIVAWGIAAFLTPILLEYAGVLGATATLTPAGILTTGTAIAARTTVDLVGTIAGSAALIALIGSYASAIIRGRAEAMRASHVQAWQLQQLLPRR